MGYVEWGGRTRVESVREMCERQYENREEYEDNLWV